MSLSRYGQYIAGLWCFWLALLGFWLAVHSEPLRWLVTGLAVLFGLATAYILGIARYRALSGHPLFDTLSTTQIVEPHPGWPTKKRAEWQRWREVYILIAPLISQGYTWKQIKA